MAGPVPTFGAPAPAPATEAPVDVLAPDGRQGRMPSSAVPGALQFGGFRLLTPEMKAHLEKQAKFGGRPVAAGAAAAARTLLPFGIGARLMDASGVAPRETQEGLQEENPGASFVGGVAGAAIPIAASTLVGAPEAGVGAEAGEIGIGAADVAGAGPGLIAKAGAAVGGGVPGAAVEGGLYGFSNAVDQSYLQDHPLTSQALIADIGLGALGGAGFAGGLALVGKGLKAGSRAAMEHVFEQTTGYDVPQVVKAFGLTAGEKDGLVTSHFMPGADDTGSVASSLGSIPESFAAGKNADKLFDSLQANQLASHSTEIVNSGKAAAAHWQFLMDSPMTFVPGSVVNEQARAFIKEAPSVFADSIQWGDQALDKGFNPQTELRENLQRSYSENLLEHLKNPGDPIKSVIGEAKMRNPFSVTPTEARGTNNLLDWRGQVRAGLGVGLALKHPAAAAADFAVRKALQSKFLNNQALSLMRAWMSRGAEAATSPISEASGELASGIETAQTGASAATPAEATIPGAVASPAVAASADMLKTPLGPVSDAARTWVPSEATWAAAEAKPFTGEPLHRGTVPLDKLALVGPDDLARAKILPTLGKKIAAGGEGIPPITVKPTADGRYEIMDGNHRATAARKAGLSEVPALIMGPAPEVAAEDPAITLDRIFASPDPVNAAKTWMRSTGMAAHQPEGLRFMSMIHALRDQTAGRGFETNLPETAQPPGTFLGGERIGQSHYSEPHPVLHYQDEALHNMANTAAATPEGQKTIGDFGGEIVKKMQAVDGQLDAAAKGIVAGKAGLGGREVPEDVALPKNATADHVRKIRDYLSEAAGRLMPEGHPALNTVGAAIVKELQNLLPAPPISLNPQGGQLSTTGLPPALSPQRWTPDPAAVHRYNQTAGALNDPVQALAGLAAGRLTTTQLGALNRVYPGLVARVKSKLQAEVMARGDKPLPLSTATPIRAFLSNGQDPGVSPSVLMAMTSAPPSIAPPPSVKPSKVTPAKEIKISSRMTPVSDRVGEDLEKS